MQCSNKLESIAVCLQNYVRNLIDFESSKVLNLQNFDRIEEYLARGDNVVVLANHQTEADPGGQQLFNHVRTLVYTQMYCS